MSELKPSETPRTDEACRDHRDGAPSEYVMADFARELERENQRLREHPVDCAVIDDILFELQRRGYEVTGIDGDTSPADILAGWFHGRIRQAEEDRDQWRQCAGNLAVIARTIGWTGAEDTKTLRMAEAALKEFDKLNTP